MFDISGTGRPIGDLAVVSRQLTQHLYRLIQGDTASGSNVEDPARDFFSGRLTGQQVRAHAVRDVAEVAALLTVAVDGGLLTRQHLHGKLCQHAGVHGTRVLKWAEDVEVPQGNRLQSIYLV